MVVLKELFSNPRLSSTDDLLRAGSVSGEQVDDSPPVRARVKQVRLTADQVDELVKAYQSGLSVRQCVERFSIHRVTVLAHLERRGVARRPCVRKLTDQDVADAARRKAAGESIASIARSFKVDPTTVARELEKAGI